MDAAHLGRLRENVLTEKLVTRTLDGLRNRLANRAENVDTELPEFEAQVRTVKAELERLSAALLSVDEKPELVLRSPSCDRRC